MFPEVCINPSINQYINPSTTYLFKQLKLCKELQQLTKRNLLKKPNPLLFKTPSSFPASSTPSSNLLSLIPFKSPKLLPPLCQKTSSRCSLMILKPTNKV